MKNNLKYKITLCYTALLAILVSATLIGLLFFSEYYIIDGAKTELSDELSDFCKELTKHQDNNLSYARYYDDGVLLSIYDEHQDFLTGLYPDEFPEETPLQLGNTRKLTQGKHHWIFQDKQFQLEGKTYWLRGIYSLDLLNGLHKQILKFWIIIVPSFLLLISFVGYQMLKKTLHPVYTVTKMADDISKSNDLSLRLPQPQTNDELAYMTKTFNYMLNHLEEIFLRETQFTSDAAHELRTPLSVISSHCEYCLEDLPLTEEIRAELIIIYKKAQSMSDLINQLLMIARAESGTYQLNLEEVDLDFILESILEELEEKASNHHIRLHLSNHTEDSKIYCDVSLIIQIFSNLIENAINYNTEYGHVDVILENESEGFRIQIKDTGIGIAPDEIDKIWNRFYRVDASHSQVTGFGLGLFMVRWMVEIHHGKIEVQSIPDLGSIFTVYLPKKS